MPQHGACCVLLAGHGAARVPGEDMRDDDCAVPVGVESLTLILGVSGHR